VVCACACVCRLWLEMGIVFSEGSSDLLYYISFRIMCSCLVMIAYTNFIGKGERPFVRCRLRLKDNIEMGLSDRVLYLTNSMD
jgi:hypothetical protein